MQTFARKKSDNSVKPRQDNWSTYRGPNRKTQNMHNANHIENFNSLLWELEHNYEWNERYKCYVFRYRN